MRKTTPYFSLIKGLILLSRHPPVGFVEVFFEDGLIDVLEAGGVEAEVVGFVELGDGEAEEFFFGEVFVLEELAVLGDGLVGLGFEVVEGLAELPLAVGEGVFFEEALMQAGVFRVVGVFGGDPTDRLGGRLIVTLFCLKDTE